MVTEDSNTHLLIFSVLELLCCNQITGILGIVFFLGANDALKKGDTYSFYRNTRYCKISLLCGLIIAILGGIVAAIISISTILLSTY